MADKSTFGMTPRLWTFKPMVHLSAPMEALHNVTPAPPADDHAFQENAFQVSTPAAFQ